MLALADGEVMAVGLVEAFRLERVASTLGTVAAVCFVGIMPLRLRRSAAVGPANHQFERGMGNVFLENCSQRTLRVHTT